jgi:carotenoid cleavage dioxygenase-like enzyme
LTDKDGNKYRTELMSVSPNSWGKDSCFAFGLAYHALGSARMEDMAVFKVDTCQAALVAQGDLPANTTTVTPFHQADIYPGEPIFVPNPEGKSEDDGTILAVAKDGATGNTTLLMINALTMTQVASVQAPFGTMFEFHGQFFPKEDVKSPNFLQKE